MRLVVAAGQKQFEKVLLQSDLCCAADAGAAHLTKDSDSVAADPGSHGAGRQLHGSAAAAVLEVAGPVALEEAAGATEDHALIPDGAVDVVELLAAVVVVAAAVDVQLAAVAAAVDAQLAEGRKLRLRTANPGRRASELR